MKKVFALMLVLSLLLCGCTAKPAGTTAPTTQAPTAATTEATVPTTQEPTQEPTTVPTEEPTTAPTEPPVIASPLTGEILEEPQTSRIFAVSINNIPAGLPMYGVSKADIFFEMFVNGYCTRGLALFGDVSQVDAIGSIRSLRYNFTDLCQSYDAIVVHASGSQMVLDDLAASGVPNVSVEKEISDYYFRDQSRMSVGYAYEHCLFVWGAPMVRYAESKGIRVTREADADYGLRFTEDGTPAGGEEASRVEITLIHDDVPKATIMEYDSQLGKYRFFQYGKAVRDGREDTDICFENVLVMFCKVENDSVYHVADLLGSGEGYFACGGKLIPIRWHHENMEDPITFTLTDGTPLQLGVGNSYIAIAPLTSTVEWE